MMFATKAWKTAKPLIGDKWHVVWIVDIQNCRLHGVVVNLSKTILLEDRTRIDENCKHLKLVFSEMPNSNHFIKIVAHVLLDLPTNHPKIFPQNPSPKSPLRP